MNDTYHVLNINQHQPTLRTPVPPLPSPQGLIGVPDSFDDEEDFSKLCRLCATTIQTAIVPLFEGEGLQNQLAEKINEHLPIKVSPVDELPRVVCERCAGALLAWLELRRACLRAQDTLHARLASINNSRLTNGDTAEPDDKASAPGDCAPDDDEPPAAREGAYGHFYRALIRFRDHFATTHESNCAYPEFTDSSETSEGADEDEHGVDRVEGGRGAERYDDLSGRSLRRSRRSPATRAALQAAAERAHGAGYACACGKRLGSAHTYVFHARIHTGERPCVCHVCGAQFRAPHALRRHVAETHERARRPACRTCRRTFANAHNLRQHERTHTGERPYVCARCGKRFTQSGSLHAHRRTHSAERPHACALCPAAFRLRGALRRHRLLHSAERPAACDRCPRAFRSRPDLAAPARAPACLPRPAALRSRRDRPTAPPSAPPPGPLDANPYEP